MNTTVWRAAVIALFSVLSLAVPLVGPARSAVFVAVFALVAISISGESMPGSLPWPTRSMFGSQLELLTFLVVASLLGGIAIAFDLAYSTYVGTLFLVGFGLLSAEFVREFTTRRTFPVIALCSVGGTMAVVGQSLSRHLTGDPVESAIPLMVFIAANGALLAGYVWAAYDRYLHTIVLVGVVTLSWLLLELEPTLDVPTVTIAIVVIAIVGYLSFALEAASIAGMFTGVLLGLLTIVLGGFGWFAVLLSFFAIGSFSTKYRYDVKLRRGMAEPNDGARTGANVLGNATIALVAVLGFAATDTSMLSIDQELFVFAFAGSLATALSDTLSSEIGGVYDHPRLITTFEPVAPGTDGGITWQGELAGVFGAILIGAIAYAVFAPVTMAIALVIGVAGIVGMTVDSLLGATIEGRFCGNQGVNFVATLIGAIVGAGLPLALGL